jgi:F0F1-type ATP synthase delta subunit
MEKLYAKAIENLLAQGSDEKKLVAELTKHLTETGRVKLLPGILRHLRVLEARKAKLAPSVEAASEKEAAAAVKAAKAEGIEVAHATVNPALIRGWRARTGGTLIDRSAKQGLIELYRKVTT